MVSGRRVTISVFVDAILDLAGELVVDRLLASDEGVASLFVEAIEVAMEDGRIDLELDLTVGARTTVVGQADLLLDVLGRDQLVLAAVLALGAE